MAIAVFSPPLDARGNSVRGIRVFNDLSERFRMHMFQAAPLARYVIRNRYDASAVGSKRLRRAIETKALAEHGRRVAVYELQGDLTLFSVERVVRELLELPPDNDYLIVDFGRVLGADGAALELWRAFVASACKRFREIIVTGMGSRAALKSALTPSGSYPGFAYMDETDAALEHCEDCILGEVFPSTKTSETVRLEEFDVCEGLDEAKLAVLLEVLQPRHYRDGDLIVKRGDPASGVFFLTRGQVSIFLDLPGGGARRLSTCTPGMLFGEMAILERRPRSASVRADGNVECYELPLESFDRLTATEPELKVKLLQNFAQRLSIRLRKLTEEVSILGASI
jgi:glutaminase